MKKLFAIFLGFVLILGCTFAEGWDTPALKNPKDRYEYYVEKTDGSDTAVYVMLDAANDEAAVVEEYGALKIINNFVDEDGETTSSIYTWVQNSEFGRMVINSYTEMLFLGSVYTVGPHNYSYSFGVMGEEYEMGTPEDFDWYWESYHFPYGSLEVLNGIRQDENGYTYYLVKSNDGMSFEFVTGEGMEIVEIRIYETDENSELSLMTIVHFEKCAALELPDKVAAAIRADLAE